MQSKLREPASVNISVQLYQLLVRVYPSRFRHQYGDLMVQVFRDSCLQANHQSSPDGLLLLWVRTLVDTLLSAIEQYSNRGTVMTKSGWIKLSGWFMAASSVLSLVGWLASTRPDYNEYNAASWPIDGLLNAAVGPLIFMGVLFIACGILGLWARFGKQAGSLGQAGLIISLAGAAAALVGVAGLSISDSSPWWETAMIGLTVLFIGLVLFGISCLQRKLFSRWNSLPLLTSILWPLLVLSDLLFNSITNSGFEMPGSVVAIVIIAAFTGVGLVGYLLQADARKLQSATA